MLCSWLEGMKWNFIHFVGGSILAGRGAGSPALPESGVPSDGVREPVGGGGVDDIMQLDMLVEARAHKFYEEIQGWFREMVSVENVIFFYHILLILGPVLAFCVCDQLNAF
jgi:hypothetical protein